MRVTYKEKVYSGDRLKDSIFGCVCERCKQTYATIHPYEAVDGTHLCSNCVKEIEIGERYILEMGKKYVLAKFED